MHLQSIGLKGYRSFANPSSTEFSSEITAFIGPNGTGKSNLLNALIWALGLPNPGDEGPVIFDGISNYAPANTAEVSLTITGVFRSGEPLLLSRRQTRDTGKSTVLLNGESFSLNHLPDWFPQVASRFHLISDLPAFQALKTQEPKDRIIIIDEVDAPMNEDQIKIYCDELDELVQSNQLILATHSKLTMSLASMICGVTMEEYGITKFYPMNIKGDESPKGH